MVKSEGSFWKVGQTSRSRTSGHGVKGFVKRNAHFKYEILIYTDSKVMAKVKVCKKYVNFQGHFEKKYNGMACHKECKCEIWEAY